MKPGRLTLIGALIIFAIVNVAAFSQTKLDWVETSVSRQNSQEMDGTSEPVPLTQQKPSARTFLVSNEQLEGTLDPVRVKQSGYYATENLSAKTDTGTNTKANLTIDEENGWSVNQADLELWNLQRLYVANGNFDDDTSDWSNYTHDSSGGNQTQIVSYNDMSEYVTVENRGEKHPIRDRWTHYDETEVIWNQTITNVPLATNFTLNFKFQYASGLLDPIGDDFKNFFWLVIRIDDQEFTLNLVALESRSTWYEIVPASIYLPSAPSTFEFEIGLYIDSTVTLYASEDYDDDGFPDGVANAAFCEVFFDDVSLVSEESPSFDEVDLKFHAGEYNTSIIGSGGSGNATIVNPSFWTNNPLKVEVTSNTSVSFDYRARILSHRLTNTSWAADPHKPGVLFSAASNQNLSLTMYTYVGTFGEYENLTITIDTPTDWENPHVHNPFLNDVTGQCIISTGRITLPANILDRLGWWQIILEAPNYAKLISIQKYNEGSGLWDYSTQFRSGNTTRTQISLGTDVSTPDLSNPVNLTWLLPNASIWSEESLTSGFNGQVNSTSWMLGALNTSAGQWSVSVCWTNGTEVAYGTANFDMYHTATLTPKHAEIQTESGLVVTNFLYYVDADNGEYLMDEVATIEGNWSSSTLTFNPNLLHNWWETDFDTAAVGGGVHLVIVNAYRPHFDNVSCQFTIESTLLTEFALFVDSGPPIEVGLNEKHIYEFRYELLNGTGIDDAIIDVNFSPTIGLNVTDLNSTAPGNYSVEIFSFQSGAYTVTVSANKSYHYVGFDSFMIEVGGFGATLSKENGSADLVSFGADYRFVVQYANMTGDGLTGATVEIVDMAPSDWIPVGPLVDEGNGYYSIRLSPPGTGTFTVVVKANFTNHETQYATFSLTVAAVTIKVVDIQGLSGAEDQLTTITLSVVESNTGHPVTSARVVVQVFVNLEKTQNIQLAEVGEGQYSGQFIMPSSDTIAEIRIYASLDNYILDGEYFQTELHPEMSAFALLTRTVQQYSPLLFLIGALVVGFIVQKVQSRRSKAEYIDAMVVKKRFDDVRDLLGVIVLHGTSGIPIYSNLIKGGIDDSMLSGFIAAITQFRSEFDVDLKEWQIIPISDIIRTVSTQNLICAFITLGSPSGTQEERMMQFARAIGFIFDSHFENAPIHVLNDETQDRFETLFNEMLDGALLVKYRTVEAHKLPRNLRLLEKGAAKMDKHDEFELEELASIMTRSGLEEARAYKTIMDGIEIGYLEPIDLEPYTGHTTDSD